jgi:hypothetical protein
MEPGASACCRRAARLGGVADGRVVHAEAVADGADHHLARVEPHAEAQRLFPLADRVLDRRRGEDRALRVVLVGDRRAEERHEAIAEELIDGALVAVDLGEAEGEEPVQEVVHGLGAQAFGQGRGVGDVAEEHGDLLALALEGAAQGEDLVGQMLGRVGLGARERPRRRRGGERRGALATESAVRRIRRAAGATGGDQGGRALPAESRASGIVVLASGALHARDSPGVLATVSATGQNSKIGRPPACGWGPIRLAPREYRTSAPRRGETAGRRPPRFPRSDRAPLAAYDSPKINMLGLHAARPRVSSVWRSSRWRVW